MKTVRIIWPADIRLQQERPRATLTASRTRCAVHHTSHHTMWPTLNESRMFLLPVRLHTENEAQITNSNHRVEIRARPASCVLMQPLQGHSSITRPRSTHPGACLTYAGLSGPRQGRMLSFHACLKRGGGARSVVQLLPSFCHMFLWAPHREGSRCINYQEFQHSFP